MDYNLKYAREDRAINKQEEAMLKVVLHYYRTDFSHCVKELMSEKLEDLRDIGFVKRIKEGKPSQYASADKISALFKE